MTSSKFVSSVAKKILILINYVYYDTSSCLIEASYTILVILWLFKLTVHLYNNTQLLLIAIFIETQSEKSNFNGEELYERLRDLY